MALELLLQEAQGMSEDDLMKVIRYMRFIKIEDTKNKESCRETSDRSNWIRKPGGLSGKIIMMEGFDDPIEGFEEYM